MSDTFDDIVKITKESLSVIEMMECLGCAPLEANTFYRTFNDSLIFLTCFDREIEVCVHVPDFIKEILAEKIDEIVEERKKAAAKDAQLWKAMVLEGGHHINEITGERPGEVYFLDKNSRYDLSGKHKRYAQALCMSLRKKVCNIKDIKPLQLGSVDG